MTFKTKYINLLECIASRELREEATSHICCRVLESNNIYFCFVLFFFNLLNVRFAGSSSLRVAEEVRDLCQKRVVINPGNESGQRGIHFVCLVFVF